MILAGRSYREEVDSGYEDCGYGPFGCPSRLPGASTSPLLFRKEQDFFLRMTGDPVRAQQMTLRGLQELRDRQAAALAYFDVFWSSAVVATLLVLLLFLMRRSVAEKGAHVGAE